ncbi:acyltransferase family protein [Micromonospora sp. NPDC047644]|uniref:acyltransferase family protein n=1 Tax=Micromonospora sp. NPDC047644 TaxID=3157203 RepID=UPI003454C012
MAATSTTPAAGNRSAGVDLLRIVGIAAVVVGHVWSDDLTRASIYTWHVPVFFVLTGYFWSPGRPLGGELRKRWTSLGVPYVVWFLILVAALLAADAATGQVAPGTFGDALYGGTAAVRPFSAFWFVSVLFIAAVAFRWLERFPAAVAWTVAVVGLVTAYLAPSVVTAGPLGLFLVPACLVFVLAGRLLRRLRPRLPASAGAASLSIGVGFVLLGLNRDLDLKAGDFGSPVLGVLTAILISVGLIRLAEELDLRIGARASRVISRLAGCGIAVVLSHAGILWVLQTPRAGRVVDLVAALVVPWVFAWIVISTPLGPWLTGTRIGGSARAASGVAPRPGAAQTH